MESVEDGSGSPESLDDDVIDPQAAEDNALSKNRSKRKPSKTQIKHIAPNALPLTESNERTCNDNTGNSTGLSHGPQNSARNPTEQVNSVGSVGSRNRVDNCDTSKYGTQNMEDLFNDVTQGIFRDSGSQPDLPHETPSRTPLRKSRRMASSRHHSTSLLSSSSRPAPCYPCGICGKVFRVPSRYDSHMLGHSKGKPYCCNTCGKMFISQEKLDRHLPVHNCDRNASFTCEVCGKVCVNWRAYLYHMKAKHTEAGGKRYTCNVRINHPIQAQKTDRNASYTCETCGKVCVNWRAYIYHQRSRHTESGGKRFSCNLCGRQFHTRHRLRNHMISHEKGKHHCCHVCGKLFESRKKLDIHTLVHNLTSMHDQQLQCGDCGRQYTEWIAFKQHMKTHGADGVQYPCALCDETFPTQYEMEKHKRVHKQFQCEFCNRFFRSASVLSVHLRVHTGERPYKCGLCERDFSQSSVLKVHMRTHSKEGRYECKLCGQVFGDVMEYFRHHIAHLEEGNLQCEECGKLFECINNKNRHMAAHRDRSGRQCHVCGKEFGRVSHLEAHMLCHSDQLPLMCKVCGKMFSSQEVLTAHYSSHMTGDISSDIALSQGPLFCNLCGKMFKDQVYLDNHMKKHENESIDIKPGEKILDEDVVEVDKGQFACGDCGKAFGKAHHLTVHRREHTGERPHTCCMCGQNFMLRTQLLQHIREHRRSGLMMYLNLNAGKVCTTDDAKPPKIIPRPTPAAESDTGSETETDGDHEENVRMTRNVSSNGQDQPQLHPFSGESPPAVSEPRPSSYSDVNNLVSSNANTNHTTTNNSTNSNTATSSNNSSSIRHASPLPQPSQRQFPSNLSVSYSEAMSPPPQTLQGPPPHPTTASTLPPTPAPHPHHHHLSQHSNSHMHLSMHMSMKDEPYLHADIQMSHGDHMSPAMHLHMKNEGSVHMNMQMLRPEPHMPTNMHMSAHQDYKNDVGHHYALPYSKAYLPAQAMSNVQLRNSFQAGFHPAPGRFAPDMHHPMSNFQLLPQTAFPENSHHP